MGALYLLLFAVIGAFGVEVLPYQPQAAAAAMVYAGLARFTVLTPQVIRMEYSSNKTFEDQQTLAVVNRLLPIPKFTSFIKDDMLIISTSALNLTYIIGAPFAPNTLYAVGTDGGAFKKWNFGDIDYGNLLGTIRGLDGTGTVTLNCTLNVNVTDNGESLHCAWAVMSRLGWTTINETGVPVLNSSDWWNGYSSDDLDYYLFAHGHDYKQALYDWQSIGGKIIMVPRYATGIMWSRWYNINDYDSRKTVSEYQSRGLPLDVYIFDMNWHTKNDWTGYSFDPNVLPYPNATMAWLHHQGLRTSCNVHDADGVMNFEVLYPEMAEAMGVDPSTGATIAFSMVNETYVNNLEDIMCLAVENQGVDFWWIDWQQGGTAGGCDGNKQNPTIWLAHIRSTDHARRGQNLRGMVLSRFGGLGHHRYQVGFSGDVQYVNWQNFAYQPYFTLTASNVGFGYWSHDLVGFPDDPDLQTKWLQWGAWSGVFRTHDRGMSAGSCADDVPFSCAIVEVWKLPYPYFDAVKSAMRTREELNPYIYTAMRQAYDSGLCLLRPMYYDWPECETAYGADLNGSYAQYMFGDDLLVAPIVSPTQTNNMTTKRTWLPPGLWFEIPTGALIQVQSSQGQDLIKDYDRREVPVFAVAGSVIPTIPIKDGDTLGIAARQYTTLIFNIIPGAASGETAIYEDDGITVNYINGSYAWTTCTYNRTDTQLNVIISTSGTFPQLPTSRKYFIRIVNSLPPLQASINDIPITYDAWGGDNTWMYEGDEVTTVIEAPIFPITTPVTFTVKTDPIDQWAMSGIKGGVQHAIWAKANYDEDWTSLCAQTGEVCNSNLTDLASFGEILTVQAGMNYTAFTQTLNNFTNMYLQALYEVKGMKPPPPNALVQLYYSGREDSLLCGSQTCLETNNFYTEMRIEGYQPNPGTANIIPFYDYWNANVTDNWSTTSPVTPSGYIPVSWPDGWVLSQPGPGTSNLSLWFSSDANDHLTVGTPEGVQWAQSNGYVLLNATLGYVLTEQPDPPPGGQAGSGDLVTHVRWLYSLDLILNALN